MRLPVTQMSQDVDYVVVGEGEVTLTRCSKTLNRVETVTSPGLQPVIILSLLIPVCGSMPTRRFLR